MNRHIGAFVVMGMCALAAHGCGPSADSAAESGAAPAAQADEPGESTPTELGNRIGKLYVEALTEVTDAMTDRPAAADLQPTVEAMMDRYIEQFVELGRQKEALSDADKATVNSRVSIGISSVPSELFSSYAEGQRHYQQGGDMELARMIGEFNVITQYADFDLLKKQSPSEAERLGLE
jgi:hypothetical protein